MIDTIPFANKQQQHLPTHQRGQHRIDIVLISQSLQTCLLKAQILPLNTIVTSDHRALIVDLQERALFG